MKTLKLWMSNLGIAGLFAITRQLESRNKELLEENIKLKEKLDEQLEKIYYILGVQESSQVVQPLSNEQEVQQVPQLPSDVVAQAEQEDWIAWQQEERIRLLEASHNMRELSGR